ncbi:MAG TPA: dihydrofolate reductase [Flavitalea sp.]|nr:dihydrofolate reductase [Flavitalea sp.]
MTISIIVAASDNNIIGKDNKLLWKLPNDLAFFKNTTWGMPMVMGRKTYESMSKFLAGRTNIVITRNAGWKAEGAVVVSSLEEGIREAEKEDVNECFVIGGGEVYKQAIKITDKVYLTRVHTVVEGDTSFPELDPGIWMLEKSLPFAPDDRHAFAYDFQTWIRKS